MATVWADGRIEGEEELVERELACVIEGSEGRLELLRPSEFRQQVDDHDRRVAEWVLGRGGKVYVCLEGEEPKWEMNKWGFIGDSNWLKSAGQLPNEAFTLLGVHISEATPEDFRQIASCKKLECLRIYRTTAEPVFSGMKRLKCVDFSNSKIGDQSLATLVDAHELLALCLTSTKVTNKGLSNIKQLKTIRRLCLHNMPISDAGLVHLAGLTNLETLLLGDTSVSDAGLVHLAGLTNLKWLWLDNTRVSLDGLAQLKNCQNLEYVGLPGLTSRSKLEPFPLPRSLHAIDLHNEHVTDEELKYLYPSQFLKTIDLRNTQVTAEGVARLREAIPGCTVRCNVGPPQSRLLPNGWSFSSPTNLGPAVNSSQEDDGPALSSDGLTLYFDSAREGEGDSSSLWTCTRPSPNDPFGAPTKLGPPMNSSDTSRSPAISSDGLTLFFESDRPGGQGGNDVWMCTRTSTSEPFGELLNLGPTINSKYHDRQPAISADGLTLLFCSDRPIGSDTLPNRDIWMSTRKSTSDPFGKPVRLGTTVNSAYNDEHPAISPDGLTLLFSSQRLGGWGDSDRDLWMSTRKSLGDPFGESVNLGSVANSGREEGNPAFSPDGNTLLFTSDRPGGQGKSDLWMVQIHRPGEQDSTSSGGPPAIPTRSASED